MIGRGIWPAVLIVGVLWACGKSEARKQEEVRKCVGISFDVPGATQCLVLEYKWDSTEAFAAARLREREMDSVAHAKADAAWLTDGAKHRSEMKTCGSSDMARCLQDNFGWTQARAVAAADSEWSRDAAQHRKQMADCGRRRGMGAGACLQLYYKWSPERALA